MNDADENIDIPAEDDFLSQWQDWDFSFSLFHKHWLESDEEDEDVDFEE